MSESKALKSEVIRGKEGVGPLEKAEPCPGYNTRGGDCLIDGRGVVSKGSHTANNNAAIVLGRDRGRTGTTVSGYGGTGEDRAGSIDLVAGRMSPSPQKVDSKGEPYINDPIFTYCFAPREAIKDDAGKPLNYFNDAARVYISQRTDVDYNFAINPGRSNPSPVAGQSPASAIVLQSDDIRLVSRRGIKIVTLGSRGYGDDIPIYTSEGAKVTRNYGIDLIAGNGFDPNGNKAPSEPLVKGKQLAHCLNELSIRVEEIQEAVFKLMKDQVKFNSVLMTHTHGESFGGQITLWSPSAQGGAIKMSLDTVKSALSTMHSGMNLADWRMQWLGPEIKNTIQGETNFNAGATAKFNSKYNSTN
jgi:hypothetical protein